MGKSEIDIRIEDAVAIVDAAHASVIAPILSYQTRVSRAEHGIVRGYSKTETLGRVASGAFRFPAKLCAYVQGVLNAKDYSVRLDSRSFGHCRPDPDALDACTEPFRSIFSLPRIDFGGLFKPGPAINPEVMIPLMLRLFPTARVVIPVRNRSAENSWICRLRDFGVPQRICSATDLKKSWCAGPKVLVSSFAKFDSCQRFDFDLIVVPEVRPLMDNMPWDPDVHVPHRQDFRLLRDPTAPAFGFLPYGRFSHAEFLRLSAMFIREIPLPGRKEVCVRVRAIQFESGRSPRVDEGSDLDPAPRKRASIWMNDYRNEFVANLAEAETGATRNRIAVLVENLSHARELSRHLPSWTVRSRGSEAQTTDADRKLIVTESALMATGTLAADVVIDARGGSAVEQNFIPLNRDDPLRAFHLIDISDRGPNWLATNAKRRRGEYASRKWESSTESPG